jgi:hypothetical protein
MRYFTLFLKKNWPRYVQKTEKNSEEKIRPLAVLREEASDSFLPVYKI